ncbi:unnamed protein product [Protopolystoma xenopodis]|uniref:Uncharacterized protein n=1 Tax=Protopolystoma xenopodis TaxID=117903 RepID=A0A3S5BAK3_9PLAT|nr:unnamed protein product [Protopolystoma xenopodis]
MLDAQATNPTGERVLAVRRRVEDRGQLEVMLHSFVLLMMRCCLVDQTSEWRCSDWKEAGIKWEDGYSQGQPFGAQSVQAAKECSIDICRQNGQNGTKECQ